MPIGVWLAHRRDAAGRAGRGVPRGRSIDLNEAVQRRAAAIFLASTLANILIVSVAAYSGIEYMDSPQFCGQLCHEVMEPEWAGYQEGPHSRVACVQCHIGPGAPWFVKSKLSGLRQVVRRDVQHALAADSRRRSTTCARRATPASSATGPRSSTATRSGPSGPTPTTRRTPRSVTTLRMHIGGDQPAGQVRHRASTGTCRSMNRIEYIATDDKRQVIPYVRLDDGKGNVTEFFADGVTDAASLHGRAARARLRRLPQPPVAHLRVLGRARRRRGDRRRRVRRRRCRSSGARRSRC